jgi:hypothetical protein
MRSLTLHIPKRAKDADDYTIQVYRWTDGEINKDESASAVLEKGLFASGGPLDLESVKVLMRKEEGDSAEFSVYGRKLFRAVHTGDVAQVWDEERELAATEIDNWNALTPAEKNKSPKPSGLRVYFSVEDETLAAVPWELIRFDFPLFFDRDSPMLRCEKRKLVARKDVEVWPIRILVVDAFTPTEADTFASSKEIEAIRMALRPANHLFDIDILQTRSLETCTPETFRRKLSEFRPHIFHFIGHGLATGDQAHLVFCDRATKDQKWTAEEIALAIKGMGGVLRLAFVNACRSGLASGGDAYSVGQAFFKAAALSVIAMQADVSGKAAEICSGEFYSALAKRNSIDMAIAAARLKLSGELGKDKRNPYVPVLTVRAVPEQILSYPVRPDTSVIAADELDDVRKYFLDRRSQRAATINTLFDTGLDVERRSALVIRGGHKIGKTWMCKWFLHACAATGTPVYRLEAFTQKDWLEVLLAFCEGSNPSDSFTQSLPKDARNSFYSALGQLAGQAAPPAGSKPAISLADLKTRNDAQDKVMKAFHDALKQAAGSGQIVIALDRLREGDDGLPNAHLRSLQDYLWERIAQEPEGPVKLVVILPGLEKDRYEATFSTDLWKVIDLEEFPSAEVPSLIRQRVLLKYPKQLSLFERIFNPVTVWNPLPPATLVAMCDTFAAGAGD